MNLTTAIILNKVIIQDSNSSFLSEFRSPVLNWLQYVEPYYLMSLVLIGLLGNTLSFCLFISNKLNLGQSNCILAALAIADNGFLLSLFTVNFKYFDEDYFNNSRMVCKINVYFNYVFAFLSPWLVVLFNIQRLIIIYYPVYKYKNPNPNQRSLLIVSILVISALCIYSYSLFTSDIETNLAEINGSSCITNEKWFDLAKNMALADTMLSMFIPFLIISIVNILIIRKLFKFRALFNSQAIPAQLKLKRFSRLKSETIDEYRFSSKRRIILKDFKKDKSFEFMTKALTNESSPRFVKLKYYSKTTRLLILISSVFLILHTPISLYKIYFYFKTSKSTFLHANTYEEVFDRVSCCIYYLNFSLNFLLYTFNESKFKNIFKSLFKRLSV